MGRPLTMTFARTITHAVAGLALALGLGAAGTAAAETKIKFTLDWVIQGPTSPFLYALQKGYYKAAGLDVTVDAGPGSAGPLPRFPHGASALRSDERREGKECARKGRSR